MSRALAAKSSHPCPRPPARRPRVLSKQARAASKQMRAACADTLPAACKRASTRGNERTGERIRMRGRTHQVEQLLELPELIEREVRVVLQALLELAAPTSETHTPPTRMHTCTRAQSQAHAIPTRRHPPAPPRPRPPCRSRGWKFDATAVTRWKPKSNKREARCVGNGSAAAQRRRLPRRRLPWRVRPS